MKNDNAWTIGFFGFIVLISLKVLFLVEDGKKKVSTAASNNTKDSTYVEKK